MKKYLCILIVFLSVTLMGCKKDELNISELVTFSNEEGIASGVADFKTETPDINISNIRSYVGEDIDYSSKVDVKNLNAEVDFQMWVDASKVDIFKKGDYEAVYKFVYDKKSIEKKIIVSIIEKEESVAADSTLENVTNSTKTASLEKGTKKTTSKSTSKKVSNTANGSTKVSNNSNNVNNSEAVSNGANAANGVNAGNGENAANGANAGNAANGGNTANVITNGSNPTVATTNSSKNTVAGSKVMVTSAFNNITTKIKNLGYMNIELLSGSTVKIKCTTTKYIVSTRTDVSTITKNGENYKVSKLVIKYNTGEEQVLETNQVKIN